MLQAWECRMDEFVSFGHSFGLTETEKKVQTVMLLVAIVTPRDTVFVYMHIDNN